MRTYDTEILQFAAELLQSGDTPWLCTIVATTGSSPRPVGSMLVVDSDGRQRGSVSGGCVEEDLLERIAAGEFSSKSPTILEYGLQPEENERLGLPCGGRLTLLLQHLSPSDDRWLAPLLEKLEQRHCAIRQVNINNGATTIADSEQFKDLEFDKNWLEHCLGPRIRLLLVGAGQLAESLAELALAMDYDVVVTDPRQQALDQWRGPGLGLIQGMPDDIILSHANDRYSMVITLTHDPRIDDMALMQALQSPACYVGALGSKRTTEKRLERLRQLDLSDEQIQRLHAPVGLDIGSKTPLEIAVSIMAQLTYLRRKSNL